jgi:Na+/H+-dicarboxylate symporter
MRGNTLALRVLIGLIAGFLVGLALAASPSDTAAIVVNVVTPIGTLFVNLIRMTAMPLVVSLLVASVGAMTTSGGLGKTGARALLISLALLTAAAVGSALVASPILARVSIDQAAALALRGPATAAAATSAPQTLGQWLVDLVPQNVFKSAADGAMLPVIIFAVVFGLALSRVSDERREAALQFVGGIAATMQRLVGWILDLAPIGVFALAIPLAAKLGLSAAGAVLAYVALVVVLTVLAVALLLYPLGILAGRMSLSKFVAYCAPSQAIAFAARSSLATIPAMVESAEKAGLPPETSRFILPLGASVFRFGAAVGQTVGVLFLARLFGVALTTPQLASVVLAVVVASFAVPGIPGGSIIAMVPVLTAANLPVEGVGILLAVDTIPDMFRTTANCTGALTLAAVVSPDQAAVKPAHRIEVA